MGSVSIRTKTVLGIALIEAVMLAGLLMLMNTQIRSTNLDALEVRANTTAQLFAITVQDAVLSYDLASLESFVSEVITHNDVVYAKILDTNGSVLAHRGADTEALPDQSIQTVDDDVFDTRAEVIVGGQAYGEVRIGMDISPVVAMIDQVESWGVSIAVAELLLVALFSTLLGYYIVSKLNLLNRAMQRVTDGDLKTPLTWRGDDEVDRVIRNFEWMRQNLSAAQDRSYQLNQTLEQQVAERTQELQARNQELQTTKEREAQVFAIVGHEIRTPLSVMKMMVSQPKEEWNLDQIPELVDHTLDLVDDMSLIASIDSGRELEYQPVVVDSFLSKLVDTLRPIAQERQFTLSYQPSAATDLWVNLPVKIIRQLVTNLVKNAIVHSEGDTVEVKLSCLSSDDQRSALCIEFVDNGKGIPREDRERLFTAFERGATQSEGSGIGLAVSRKLIVFAGGELSCEDREDGASGCRFVATCTFDTTTQPVEAEVEVAAPSASPLASLNVIVAEDNPTLRLLSNQILTRAGAQVRLAEDGEQALELFKTETPDLVITDIMMPNLDGYGLTQAIRELGFDGPVVGVTAATVGMERENLLQAGASEVFAKPIDVRKLEAFVYNLRRDPQIL